MKRTLYILIFTFINMSNIHAQNEDYLFMVEQAIKAPSGHNTQPWLFKINDNDIEIHPNLKKSLLIVDSENRELFISLGCAAENLCITASQRGYDSKVSIAHNGIITIGLEKSNHIERNSLFEQIAVRQTNRSIYNGDKISTDTLNILKNIFIEEGVAIYLYENGTEKFDSLFNFVLKGNTIQMQDRKFTDELKSWMRFNKKHQNTTNDGLSYAVFGAPNLPMFIVKPIMSGYLNEKKQNKGDIKKMQSSSHFVLFTTQNNTLEQWINLGRTLERYLLKSTELGIAHSYLNQPNEIKDLSIKMANTLQISEYPTILLRIGYGKIQPYSKRKKIEEVIMYKSLD